MRHVERGMRNGIWNMEDPQIGGEKVDRGAGQCGQYVLGESRALESERNGVEIRAIQIQRKTSYYSYGVVQ